MNLEQLDGLTTDVETIRRSCDSLVAKLIMLRAKVISETDDSEKEEFERVLSNFSK